MQLTIHRGSKEIGGSCVEITTNKARVILDYGMPLIDDAVVIENLSSDELKDKKYIPSFKDDGLPTALFISHAHMDHYGLCEYLEPHITIYANEVTKRLITEVRPFLPKAPKTIPLIEVIDNKTPVVIGDLTITSYTVEHSIPHASAFTVSDGIKTVLYSGDFKLHGHFHFNISNLVKKLANKVDYLLLEGTTLSRESTDFKSENDVQEELIKLFKGDKLSIIRYSPQNLDRFISVYRACLINKKTLVIDPYTAIVLQIFQTSTKSIPQYDANNIKVYCAKNSTSSKIFEDYKNKIVGRNKISIDEIMANSSKYVVQYNFRVFTIITKELEIQNKLDNLQLIYSMWQGYLTKDDNSPLKKYYKENKLILIHSSGHADEASLVKVVEDLSPKKIIPIHTTNPKRYEELWPNRVIKLDDKQAFLL